MLFLVFKTNRCVVTVSDSERIHFWDTLNVCCVILVSCVTDHQCD